MPTLRVASFNIYFFGDRGSVSPEPMVTRDDSDLQMLASIVADLDADVIAFQEIHDRNLLQQVLDRASALRSGRTWAIAAASAPKPVHPYQIVVAVDAGRVATRGIATPVPAVKGSRRPVVVDLEIAAASVQVVALHMKSGLLDAATEDSSAKRRATECQRLLTWMGDNPVSRRVIIGDFNALPTHPSLAELRGAAGWSWPAHNWPPSARRWTTHLDSFAFDPCAIDHVGLFGLDAHALEVHCFDLNDARTRDGVTWRVWLATDSQDESRLRRISDHRPVFLDLEL